VASVAAVADSAGIAAAVEAVEAVAEQVVQDVDPEEAYLEAWMAVLVPAGRRPAFADVVLGAAGVEVDAVVVDVERIGTGEAAVGWLVGAFAS